MAKSLSDSLGFFDSLGSVRIELDELFDEIIELTESFRIDKMSALVFGGGGLFVEVACLRGLNRIELFLLSCLPNPTELPVIW